MRANITCYTRTSIPSNLLVLSHKPVAQMVLFRKWYCLYMSDKNCVRESKKKSVKPKKKHSVYPNVYKPIIRVVRL